MAIETTDKYLQIRGELRAIHGVGTTLLVVTEHDEGQSTALYAVDLDRDTLEAHPLPGGARVLLGDTDAGTVYVAGTDGRVYRSAKADGSGGLIALVEGFDPAPAALALLDGDRLAVASGKQVHIVERGTGKKAKTRTAQDAASQPPLELPDEVTALASDESGQWLVAGTQRGQLFVFDCEDKDSFLQSESGKVHEGAVTALCFDPDELRVLSAGSDQKLMQTFVRGTLMPEDRGRSGMHDGAANTILVGPGERFYTTSADDSTIKQWPLGRGGRPATLKDGCGRGRDLTIAEHNGRAHLVQAGADNVLRVITMDAAGTLGQCARRIYDANAWARRELGSSESPRRETALRTLAGHNDRVAIELLTAQARSDGDASLRALATELLGGSGNVRAVQPLESLLQSPTESVRMAALEALRRFEGPASLRPLELALSSGQENIGVAAVSALVELSRKDDRAMQRLVATLDHNDRAVRLAAFDGLTTLHPVGSPEPELIALRSSRSDMRREALVRCFRRGLLAHPQVRTALRRHGQDQDADVRETAFLVSLLSEPKLATAVRGRDRDLHRRLFELETSHEEEETSEDGKEKKRKLPTVREVDPSKLSSDELGVLLEAMASRALDTCIRGAGCLATLGDARAFGTLLQLSRDDDASARVSACKALEILGDERAVQRLRLMLRDDAPQVRDAAFTALARLLESQPLEAAEAGLMAEHDDVRKRGLQVLVASLRARVGGGAGKGKSKKKSKKKGAELDAPVVLDTSKAGSEDAIAADLVLRALNDQSSAVRSEAFKAVVNLQLGGEGGTPLRDYALQSIHGDLRREVLVEVMGRIAEDWAWPLLLELFDDPDSRLRAEAFEYALKRSRSKPLDVLRAALTSRYADLRIQATNALAKRRESGATLLLVQALDDDDNVVRQLAVDALVTANLQSALEKAMGSDYSNVRVRAARARAMFGDQGAFTPLIETATAERPTYEDERELWQQHVNLALDGLAHLGSPAAVLPLQPLLSYDEPAIRALAARAIVWSATANERELLRAALQHEDLNVQYYAATALAFLGDPTGASVIFAYVEKHRSQYRQVRSQNNAVEPDDTWMALVASLSLPGDDLFLAFLDHPMEDIYKRAFLLALLLELASDRSHPTRLLAAMSSAHPSTRLRAARALELWPDTDAFDGWVVEQVNDRGDHVAPGKLTLDDVRDLAAMVAHGTGHVRMRFATLLWYLTAFDDEDERLTQRLERLRSRYADELEAARKAVPKQVAAGKRGDFDALVHGAYIGLSRQPGNNYRTVESTRLGALRHLVRRATDESLKKKDLEARVEATLPALLQGLDDNLSSVREATFAGLQALGVDPARIAAEALASAHRDMGVRGLELLTAQAGGTDARRILEEVMVERTDGLERSAFDLLMGSDVPLAARLASLKKALDAPTESVRTSASSALYAMIPEHAEASTLLRGALESRYQDLRFTAAQHLAHRKDPAALEGLRERLGLADSYQQRNAAYTLHITGIPGAGDVILDRIENDPAGTADVNTLLGYLGGLRDASLVDRLLPWVENKNTRWQAFNAARMSTGFDQWIQDAEDENADRSWETAQHPRDTAALARLFDKVYQLGDTNLIGQLMPQARWARGSEVDEVLAALTRFSDEGSRHAAIEALGWRARKRSAPLEPLLAGLEYPDPVSQFLSAEGLALVGRREGVGVLLTSAEMLADEDQRARAIAALGKLAEPRALDLLVRLLDNTEEEEVVRDAATEAIGHLASGPQGTDVFERLDKGSRADDSDLACAALRGLRWFGTAEAWAKVRAQATSDEWDVRREVAELLRHDDSAASEEVLRKIVVTDDDEDVVETAAESLRRRLGHDSLEVDYLLLQSSCVEIGGETLERIRQRAEPARLFEVLPKIHEDVVEEVLPVVRDALLSRDPLPVDEAAAGLATKDVRTRTVAAQVLGRSAGGKKPGKKIVDALVGATGAVREQWRALRDRPNLDEHELTELTRLWARLVWACGRLQIGTAEVIEAANLPASLRRARGVREEAMTALVTGFAGKDGLDVLEAATRDPDASVREIAAAGLRSLDAKRAAQAVPEALDDRASLDQLVADDNKAAVSALASAATSAHYQAVALPHLVAAGDVKDLAAAAADRSLDEPTRIGAVEALARFVGDEAADKALLARARDEDEDVELRKAAWRALRRLKRLRERRAAEAAGKRRSSGDVLV